MISKKYFLAPVAFILIAGISFILLQKSDKINDDAQTFVREIRVPGGWGYEVIHLNRILIFQESIPTIPGNTPFQSREDALKVGNLALKRITESQNAAISIHDLDSLKVDFPKSKNSPK